MHYKKDNPDDKEVASLSTIDSKSELGLETISYHAELIERALDLRCHRVVVKDTHRSTFWEHRFLRHVHENGRVTGVARLRSREIPTIPFRGAPIQCGSRKSDSFRTKVRLVLWDYGKPMIQARSVNDLLCGFYDIIEASRLMLEQDILHRDLSEFNMLLYPQWGDTGKEVKMMEGVPPLIDDLLSDMSRPPEQRKAAGMIIDPDNGVDPKDKEACDKELKERTGTPTYVARSVAVGEYITTRGSVESVKMPRLQGEVKRRYEERHSDNPRYEAYNDTGNTSHGGTSARDRGINRSSSDRVKALIPAFSHRPEHDVESIYWSMVCVLLRVRPTTLPKTKYAEGIHGDTWKALDAHKIRDDDNSSDSRQAILDYSGDQWQSLFPAEMKDVAELMYSISEQVSPEYGLWEWPEGKYRKDHLHEALQRLIFEYLYTHRDKDIALDSSGLRSKTLPTLAAAEKTRDKTETASRQDSQMGSGSRGSKRQAGAQQGERDSKSLKAADGSRSAAPSPARSPAPETTDDGKDVE